MRMMSKESAVKVYHRPECSHAQRIYKGNRIQMNWEQAEWKGYRPCKCCDGMNFLYKLERDEVQQYAEQFHMQVHLKDNKVYVITDVGCWKIIYKIRDQEYILLHRNYVGEKVRLKNVENAPYHRQQDFPTADSIMKYVKYIKEHDEFKKNAPEDYRLMPKDTKQQKKYYRAARKREERRSARRVAKLFEQIEQQEGIRDLSFC